MKLSTAQEKSLLRLHCIGDCSGGRWATVKSLIRAGLVAISDDGRRVLVTAAGKEHCDSHHATMTL